MGYRNHENLRVLDQLSKPFGFLHLFLLSRAIAGIPENDHDSVATV